MVNRTSDKKNWLLPDLASILGLGIAISCILGGLVLEGGKVADIQQLTAAMIVFGGTLGAVLVTTPFPVFLSAVRRFFSILITRQKPFRQTLERITRFAEKARRNGVASLEDEADRIDDAFLRKALNLAVDGTDLREIRDIMTLDMEAEAERRESEEKVWESAAGYAPTIGIVGAVLGLIQVMKHLENISEVGRGIAVAFVATVYGVASANVLFLPAAGKLKAHNRYHAQLREMMIDGVIAIAEGMNPRLIQLKLEPFLPLSSVRRRERPPRARVPASKLATDHS